MQTLFEKEQRADADVTSSLVKNGEEVGELDMNFAETLLLGVLDKRADLESAVAKHAPEWPLDRMDPISRAILLLGAYELLYGNDAPEAVVMNEAIEIAKEYGTKESAKFVNGVLNAIAHRTK